MEARLEVSTSYSTVSFAGNPGFVGKLDQHGSLHPDVNLSLFRRVCTTFELTSIQDLNLAGAGIGPKAAKILLDALWASKKLRKSIKTLDVSANPIVPHETDREFAAWAVLCSMLVTMMLEHQCIINLGSIGMGPRAALELATVLKAKSIEDLRDCEGSSFAMFGNLIGDAALEAVSASVDWGLKKCP